MKGIYTDSEGKRWHVVWGALDPAECLTAHFQTSIKQLERTDKQSVFQDPLYPSQTKTLLQYVDARQGVDAVVLIGELTPCVWAVGVEEQSEP